MKVLILVLSMFVSEMSISAPMTYSVKTEQLGLPGLGGGGGGPRARIAAIRARIQARRAARQERRAARQAAQAAQAQQAAPVAAGQ